VRMGTGLEVEMVRRVCRFEHLQRGVFSSRSWVSYVCVCQEGLCISLYIYIYMRYRMASPPKLQKKPGGKKYKCGIGLAAWAIEAMRMIKSMS
jgi:hypothetical protein